MKKDETKKETEEAVIEAKLEKADAAEETTEEKSEEKAEEAKEEKAEEKTEEKDETVSEKSEKAEETKVEKADEAKEEASEEDAEAKEEKTEEQPAEEKKEEEAEKADKSEVVVKLDFKDFQKDFEKFVSPIKEEVTNLAKTVNEIKDGIAKAKAPAEGASAAEETHVEKAEKSEKTEEASKEEVKKTDTSSEGASDSKLLAELADMKKRLADLESQPAPSKVVVIKKGDESGEEGDELTKIETRLGEIAKMREADPNDYARKPELADEALRLIARKRQLNEAK